MENTKRKYNANSQSPASKAARQRTAHEYDKKMIELGLIKKIGLRLPTEVYEAFESLSSEKGMTRPACLRMLIEHYRNTAQKH
ncbi:hypothetical protein [Taylorella equigenitalis]|uniref:Uncharacterized protein n=1 Tax=Taylorella equigenitalis 14/56 TaxID=1091497 RepID=I7JND4_9BURK|nr:hypothetical protein [Taylorella equigenitalis]WEE00011.1 hypothetical protein PZB79_05375 [Taylorella equigenitalis]WEE01488.1 hypothetical protein PZB80_05380 [Taylorella equigenitalis]WFD78025.1 hypothetical protein P7C95_05390 [Taylorella equigenitalis]WFD79503.1 hypothetical protein P7C94_05385 [Taylorella equigenitalis]WFD80979.1 hypothetical protein P7C86_05390 [Taylorella equigenitalis]